MDIPRMYILINNAIKMSKGKSISQGCHAVSMVTTMMIKHHSIEWERYCLSGQPKIVVRASEELMLKYINIYSDPTKRIWCCHVRDAGHTQVPENTLTALAFCPLYSKDIPPDIKDLKLL